jgi:hypothetical protein
MLMCTNQNQQIVHALHDVKRINQYVTMTRDQTFLLRVDPIQCLYLLTNEYLSFCLSFLLTNVVFHFLFSISRSFIVYFIRSAYFYPTSSTFACINGKLSHICSMPSYLIRHITLFKYREKKKVLQVVFILFCRIYTCLDFYLSYPG